MCRRETSTAAVSRNVERGSGGRGRSLTYRNSLLAVTVNFPKKPWVPKRKLQRNLRQKKIKDKNRVTFSGFIFVKVILIFS
jgi:hypothetical protein